MNSTTENKMLSVFQTAHLCWYAPVRCAYCAALVSTWVVLSRIGSDGIFNHLCFFLYDFFKGESQTDGKDNNLWHINQTHATTPLGLAGLPGGCGLHRSTLGFWTVLTMWIIIRCIFHMLLSGNILCALMFSKYWVFGSEGRGWEGACCIACSATQQEAVQCVQVFCYWS